MCVASAHMSDMWWCARVCGKHVRACTQVGSAVHTRDVRGVENSLRTIRETSLHRHAHSHTHMHAKTKKKRGPATSNRAGVSMSRQINTPPVPAGVSNSGERVPALTPCPPPQGFCLRYLPIYLPSAPTRTCQNQSPFLYACACVSVCECL